MSQVAFSHTRNEVFWNHHHRGGRMCWPNGMNAFVFGQIGIIVSDDCRLITIRLLCTHGST